MKILKYISTVFTAIILLSITSCTKKADVDVTEAKLPPIQVSSLGYQQSSPFVVSNTILQLYFGATTTNLATGKFTVEVFSGTTVTGTPVKTVTFNSWSGNDATSTATVTNHTISYTAQPTTYNNTTVYSGNILLKLSLLGLTTGGTTYSVRVTGYSADGTKTSAFTQLSFFKTV
ncbi:MAG: hypothetical protein ACRYFA_13025 [Janthinobacterium lividum]